MFDEDLLESLIRAQFNATNDQRLYWQTQKSFLDTKNTFNMDLTNALYYLTLW